MKLPAQVPGVKRNSPEGFQQVKADAAVGIAPSCDPNTQITCGATCCNAQAFYCANGVCKPFS